MLSNKEMRRCVCTALMAVCYTFSPASLQPLSQRRSWRQLRLHLRLPGRLPEVVSGFERCEIKDICVCLHYLFINIACLCSRSCISGLIGSTFGCGCCGEQKRYRSKRGSTRHKTQKRQCDTRGSGMRQPLSSDSFAASALAVASAAASFAFASSCAASSASCLAFASAASAAACEAAAACAASSAAVASLVACS